MTEQDKLRGLEIRFYLVITDLARLTTPVTIQNIFAFFDFLEKIDFTKALDCGTLKVLTNTVFTENTNLQPNKIELCNFCYTHNVKPKALKHYIRITPEEYRATISRINSETFYQPTHLQPHIYNKIETFLEFVSKLTNLGVEKLI